MHGGEIIMPIVNKDNGISWLNVYLLQYGTIILSMYTLKFWHVTEALSHLLLLLSWQLFNLGSKPWDEFICYLLCEA